MTKLPRATREWVYDSGLRGCAPLAIPIVAWLVVIETSHGWKLDFRGSIIAGILTLSVLTVTILVGAVVPRRWWPSWREFVATAAALLVTAGVTLGTMWGAAAAGAPLLLLAAIGGSWMLWLFAGDVVMPARGPARLYLWLYERVLKGQLPIWASRDIHDDE